MILAFQTLLALVALASCIAASRSYTPDGKTPTDTCAIEIPQISRVFVKTTANQLDNTAEKTEALENAMKAAIMTLDSEISKRAKLSDNLDSSAELVREFLETFDITNDNSANFMTFTKTVVALRATNLLRILSMFYVWSSPEQFHWFQAISYKSEWYSPTVWKDNPTPMDWNKNLYTIFMADNPMLLNDLESGIISRNASIIDVNAPLGSTVDGNAPLDSTIDDNTLLDLTIKHDSINIYQSLQPTFTATHLKSLVESGSFKILRFLAESKSINLHLEEYSLPHTLPEDFEFFWMQGYRYLFASHFLSLACKYGRDDILDFFYQLDPKILVPCWRDIDLAAENGHLNILKWALDHNLPFKHEHVALELVMNKHFTIFERLQEQLKLSMDSKREISNEAAKENCLNTIIWAYNKFKAVPESRYLGETSIEILEYVKVVDPRAINEYLAENASLDNLKWLSINHPHLLTDKVKLAHLNVTDFEKMQWIISQGWEAKPNFRHAIYDGELEMLRFGYTNLQIKPTDHHANVAAEYGHTKILELIHSSDPFCINKSALLEAVAHDHLKAAKYLESILKLKGAKMELELQKAFRSGNLKLIKWAYQTYKLDHPTVSRLNLAIITGHLHIVNWAIEKQFILKTDQRCLMLAAETGQYLIFQRLIDYGMIVTKVELYMMLASKSKSLEIVKYLVKKDPENAKSLNYRELFKHREISAENYHIVQWLIDENLWGKVRPGQVFSDYPVQIGYDRPAYKLLINYPERSSVEKLAILATSLAIVCAVASMVIPRYFN